MILDNMQKIEPKKDVRDEINAWYLLYKQYVFEHEIITEYLITLQQIKTMNNFQPDQELVTKVTERIEKLKK
jgi:hypothetical protein